MPPIIAKTTKDGASTPVNVDVFYLNQLPNAMRNMGWTVAPCLMEHWFSIKPAYGFTEDTKVEYMQNMDARKIEVSKLNTDIVTMAWAKQFQQVKDGIDDLWEHWNSPGGLDLLRKRIKENGNKIGYTDSAVELDATAQVNYRLIGKSSDTINDYYGALGKAILKIAVRGKFVKGDIISKTIELQKDHFIIDKVGFYIKDSYDFSTNTEFLGVWNKSGVYSKASTVWHGIYYFTTPGDLYPGTIEVFNSDFRAWQKKHNEGGDFILFSDVLWMTPKESIIQL